MEVQNKTRSKRPNFDAEAIRLFADAFGHYYTAMSRVAQMFKVPGYDLEADSILHEMESQASFLYRSGIRYLNRFNRELNK